MGQEIKSEEKKLKEAKIKKRKNKQDNNQQTDISVNKTGPSQARKLDKKQWLDKIRLKMQHAGGKLFMLLS